MQLDRDSRKLVLSIRPKSLVEIRLDRCTLGEFLDCFAVVFWPVKWLASGSVRRAKTNR
jgi:hypothetical protein